MRRPGPEFACIVFQKSADVISIATKASSHASSWCSLPPLLTLANNLDITWRIVYTSFRVVFLFCCSQLNISYCRMSGGGEFRILTNVVSSTIRYALDISLLCCRFVSLSEEFSTFRKDCSAFVFRVGQSKKIVRDAGILPSDTAKHKRRPQSPGTPLLEPHISQIFTHIPKPY